MARLHTSGAEGRHQDVDAWSYNSGSGEIYTASVTSPRTGAACWEHDSTGSNTASYVAMAITPATNRSFFVRDYLSFDALPGSSVPVLGFLTTTPALLASIRVTSAGVAQLWNETGTPAQIGSDGPTLSPGTYYRFELEFRVATGGGAASTAKARIDGTEFAASTSANLGTVGAGLVRMGWLTAPGASKKCRSDDLAVNDDQGANQNTYPGAGNIALLVPISDNARASLWTGGIGGTTSLFDAVDNKPPVGTATETNTSQIEHAGSAAGTTDAYDANMTTYTNAGIGAGATINVIVPLINHGEDVTTGTKLLTFSVVSNPAIASAGNFAAGLDGGLLGTYPSGWFTTLGTTTYAPSVTLGTSPVMRVTRPEVATRVASVDFMGMVVDYTPAAVPGAYNPKRPRSSRFSQLRS